MCILIRRMNFYCSSAFLDTIARVYFPGKSACIRDYEVDGRIYRFLVIGGRRVVTQANFLDYSEPVVGNEISTVHHRRLFVPNAVDRIVTMDEWFGDQQLRDFRPAPFLDFSEFPTFDAYKEFLLERSKARFKKNWRLRTRLEEDFGELSFTVNDDGDDVLAKSLAWKSDQLRSTGLDDLFAKEQNWEFFRELKRNGALLSSTLRANGRLLSAWLGYIHEGYWSGWIFTYDHDPALKKYSLGWQLMDSLLEECHERKLKGFDFSVGLADYKTTYGTHVRLLRSVGRRAIQDEAVHQLRAITKSSLARFPGLLEQTRKLVRRMGR